MNVEPVESSGQASPSGAQFGAFIVVPYDPFRGDIEKNVKILDQLCARPEWTVAPLSPEERRVNYAANLTHPHHRIYEVWRGGALVGILTLTRVVPGIEAVLHFVFFDGNLTGKRRLLRQFITTCFQTLGIRRLVMQVPEPVETLIRFARVKLGFRFEGETAVASHPALARLGMDNPQTWVARQGSKKEQAHWHDGRWVDVVTLRLLASEWTEQEPPPSA